MTYCGADGAGHFVKMVHNGIEYGDMQLIAEAYDILRHAGLSADELAELFTTWNKGRLESFLTSVGRRKFLMPLYSELIKTPGGVAKARVIYAKARPFYHPIACHRPRQRKRVHLQQAIGTKTVLVCKKLIRRQRWAVDLLVDVV